MAKNKYTGDGLAFYNLVRSSGLSIDEVQKGLDISNGTLYNYYRSEKLETKIRKEIASFFDKEMAEVFVKGKRLDIPPMAQQSAHKRQIPVYGVQAMAGNEYSADMAPITNPDSYIDAAALDISNNVDAVIYIWGQSMSPAYAPGTKLGIELNEDSFFAWGECYVIETRSNRLFKRVFPSGKGESWISCHSDNVMTFETGSRKGELAYPPIDIPLNDILRKFDVVASQKMHKTSKIQYLRQLRETH
jgi:hypothetical protein